MANLPAGQSECTACPYGISTAQEGSDSVDDCTVCEEGFAGTVTDPGTAKAAGCVPCPPSTYSFGGKSGSSCSPCPPGAAFISASVGCAPSTTSWAGPYDTAFTLSGTKAEGLAAFASVTAPLGVGYTSGAVKYNAGPSDGALSLAVGSHVTVPGANAPWTLPTGNSPWTASAWVKCAAPTTYAAVLEWGAPGDAKGALTQSSIVLAVEGAYQWNISALTNKGAVTTLAGSVPMATLAGSGSLATGLLGWADGVGTSAGMQSPVDVHMDQSTGTLIVVQGTQTGGFWLVRRIGLDGKVTTIAGNPTLDCNSPPTWNMSADPQPPNRPNFIDGIGTNVRSQRAPRPHARAN